MLDTLFSTPALWFTVPALLGTGVFAIRLILLALGADGHDHGGGTGDTGGGHADGSSVFQFLSFQGGAAFMMGFGWGGLAGLLPGNLAFTTSLLIGVGVGVAVLWGVGMLMRGIRRLETSGNVRADDLVGLEGTVYAEVPAGGSGAGQVTLVVRGMQRTVNATTRGGPIGRHARVRVVESSPDGRVVVEAAAGA